jgi:hypothetical protein
MYLVIQGTPERVVLRIYGTTAVIAEIDRNRKLFKRRYSLEDLSNGSLRVIREEIGPLKAEPSSREIKSVAPAKSPSSMPAKPAATPKSKNAA